MTKALDPHQVALSILSSATLEEARSKLNISRTKFWQLRQKPEIKNALNEISSHIYDESLATVMHDTTENLSILKNLAHGNFSDNQKAFVQLSACKYLMEIASKGYELKTLRSRIANLEKIANAS